MGTKTVDVSNSIKDAKEKDVLDSFLDIVDNPDAWRTVTADGIPLNKEELDIILALSQGTTADMHFDPFSPSVDFFSKNIQYHPVSLNTNPPKRRFLPSAYEAKTIKRLVHAIRNGWIKKKSEVFTDNTAMEIFDLWNSSNDSIQLSSSYISAPKIKLPGHRESYRPLPEYLPTNSTKERFEKSITEGALPTRKWIPKM